MPITRRDFLNGVAISIAAGVAPVKLIAQQPSVHQNDYYPPLLTGLRGNHPGSFEVAHQVGREHLQVAVQGLPVDEEYDLIIVGAGISGLAAACFWQQKQGKNQRILLLDNHDDFGGHAKRNEFHTDEGTIIGYGGSESFQSPKSIFSDEVLTLLKLLHVDIDRMGEDFAVDFYPDLNLSRGVYFDRKHFGVDKIVSGDPEGVVADAIPADRRNGRDIAEFINDFPLPESDRNALIALYKEKKDYLADMSPEEKIEWVDSHSYSQFLREKVGLSDLAVRYFQQSTSDFQAVGIDATSCSDARLCGMPGLEDMGLPPLDEEAQAELDDPYIYHFPDGNAGLARLMVRHLIPSVAPGNTMEDCVLAKFDYSALDKAGSPTRLRLNSTVVHAKNSADGVEVVYFRDAKMHKVKARQVVMACYNAMIPHLVPETPEEQKVALRQNVKSPLVYTNVIVRNWQPFIKLGVHDIYAPTAPYCMVKLDFPVNMGGYKHPSDPNKPICLHMVQVPVLPGSGLSAREQSQKGRAWLLGTPFNVHENMIREQLQAMLGSAGFNHQTDILAITVNRWSHGYAYFENTLFDDSDEAEALIERARQPIGKITIANSDSDWNPYAHAAIEQALRAVDELLAMQKEAV